MEYKNIAVNRKAFHEYEIIEKIEAGMVLLGSEVKSAREGKVNIKDAYVDLRSGEAILINAHISQYTNAGINNHEPLRNRKLLLNKQELKKYVKKTTIRGFTLIPLRMYFTKKGLIKIELALAKGKHSYDKRQQLKERDQKRDMARELKNYK
ncbi:MAG: SsrA-binding protein SmpB [Candidatus Aminicenantes bacterium]|nr:SsrA-binding protein SmpB [Candidatus Aminicenantes bacterium]MCK5004819.1 SsrA-binding protein SmpB [Candidatus Aminicenantes bacterium]